MQETQHLIDHAAAATDRWLFLAALTVLGVFGAWCLRWLLTTNSELLKELKSTQGAHLAEVKEGREKVVDVVTANTEALQRHNSLLERMLKLG